MRRLPAGRVLRPSGTLKAGHFMGSTQVSSTPTQTGSDKRRTTRVVQAVPIVVRGLDALGQSFKESTTTVMVNCNGCKYRSRHYVPKDSKVTVEIRAAVQGAPPRTVPAKVVWVQRPRTFREIFHVALEFDVAGNVWGIQDPPEDWFRHPDDDSIAAAPPAEPSDVHAAEGESHASSDEDAHSDEPGAADSGAHSEHHAGQGAQSHSDSHSHPQSHEPSPAHPGVHGAHGTHAIHKENHGASSGLIAVHDEPRAAHLRPVAAPTPIGATRHGHSEAEEIPDEEWNPPKVYSPEVAAARDFIRPAVKAAMSREIGRLRDRLQNQLRDALGETIRTVAQNLTKAVEQELVEQASVNMAEIIVEARKTCQAEAGALNEKIRQVVQQAINGGSGENPSHEKSFGKKRRKGKKGKFDSQPEPEKEPVTTV